MTDEMTQMDGPAEDRKPPVVRISAVQWLRENLFSSWLNTLLSLGALYIIYFAVSSLWNWGVTEAVWEAKTRRECFEISLHGACWAGVIEWFNNIIYGRYPIAEQWRINAGVIILAFWMAPFWIPKVKGKILIGLSTVAFYPFLAGYLFLGGEKSLFLQIMVSIAAVSFSWNWLHTISSYFTGVSLTDRLISLLRVGHAPEKSQRNALIGLIGAVFLIVFTAQSFWLLPAVKWTLWGGFHLTLVISGIGIVVALPGGIVLALGRRSEMPVIRMFSIAFIEIFRSVPLITVLFMATTMFPLFLPEGFDLNKLVQVIVAVCLFSSCYMAETVRAGLQAIPQGQYEAADAMGMGFWQKTALVIMPQALKHMIPNIVGSFIGLFKDTTLVSIIGLFDVLRMLQSVSLDKPWRGLHMEPLFVGALLFFIVCFAMSKYSRHLEVTLAGGQNDR